jgi:serine/threonine protein phosphatase PrpC
MGCLGTEDEPSVSLDYISKVRSGDVLMSCSDGLWHYFTPEEMAYVLDSLTPREASEFLIEKARARAKGAGDNISLAIVRIEDF